MTILGIYIVGILLVYGCTPLGHTSEMRGVDVEQLPSVEDTENKKEQKGDTIEFRVVKDLTSEQQATTLETLDWDDDQYVADKSVSKLDKEFRDSLNKLDRALMMELEEIERESEGSGSNAETMEGAEEQIHGDDGEEQEESHGNNSADEQEGEKNQQREANVPVEESTNEKSDQEDQQTSGATQGRRHNTTSGVLGTGTKVRNPSSVKKGSKRIGGGDDDIVARQLKEAAEKEQDPQRKAELWKEYRKYKGIK